MSMDNAMAFAGNRPVWGNPRTGVDQDRYLFWASGARMPSGTLVTAAVGTSFVMTKLVFGSPQYGINALRLHFSGFASTEGGNSPQETVLPGNATAIGGVWVAVGGGAAVPCAFGGAAGTAIASGATGTWTDPLAVSVPADSRVTVYTLYSTAVGEKQIPVHQIMRQRGERVWGADNAAALVALIGTDTASTAALDTVSFPAYYGPDVMVAKGWDGRPVPLVVCDSIGERQTDHPLAADDRRNMGWLRRWLDRDGGTGRIPHFVIGLPGASSTRELAASATKRWDIIDEVVTMNGGKRPFTCVLNQMGRNDYSAAYATTRAAWKALNDRILARHPGTPVIAVGQVVHPSSSDGFRTLANQGYQTGGEWPGGVRYQLEADKEALMDGTLAGYIEVVRAVGLDTTLGKWPEPFFVTTLAQPIAAGDTTIYLTDAPMPGDILHFDRSGATVAGTTTTVISVTGTAPYAATTAAAVALAWPAGQEVYAPNANDGSGTPRTGTHPRPRMIRRIAELVPQAGKANLR
jgi:hypothetical protein